MPAATATSLTKLAQQFGVGRTTLYRYLRNAESTIKVKGAK